MDHLWTRAIADYGVWLRAGGRPTSTIQLRMYQLRRVAGELGRGPWEVDAEDLVSWLAGQDWSIETRRSWRAALRRFYEWAVVTGRATRSPAAALPTLPTPSSVPRPATDDAVAAGMTAPDERVRLMVELGARLGLRRGEIARVRAEDLERDLVGWSLRVLGKGSRIRLLPCPDDVAAAIRRRGLVVGGGWLFPGADAGHLAPASVGRLVSRALPAGITCHALRHRFGTRVYRGSRDLLAVQALLGHAKPETTQRYVELDADAMRQAIRWAA